MLEKTNIITGTTKVVGVFGYPVKHSLSPAMHNAAFRELGLDWVYVPFEVNPDEIKNALNGMKSLGCLGVNVTVPLKELIAPYLDEISEDAQRIGAVNTVSISCGKMIGENTDAIGFITALGDESSGNGRKAFIYGAGGSARAVAYALIKNGWRVCVYSRTLDRSVKLSDDIGKITESSMSVEVIDSDKRAAATLADSALLVNCTPVGMYPNSDEIPALPIENMPHSSIIFDLIYRPLETQLIKTGQACGYRTLNGAEMLVQQGAVAFEIWTHQCAPVEVMRNALLNQLSQ